jgi:hypothetical protein
MEGHRTRYELRVETRLSRAALATFRVPVSPTDVPRSTVYRFRVSTDRDPSEVVHRLTEVDVQVLEIRRCHAPSPRPRQTAPVQQEPPPPETSGPAGGEGGLVIPFPRAGKPDHDPERDSSAG